MEQENYISGVQASKQERFAAAIIDLLILPWVIGGTLQIIYAITTVSEVLQVTLAIAAQFGWLIIRDMVWAPGRMLVGLRLEKTNGAPINFGAAVLRNIFLIFSLTFIEFISLLATGHRLGDKWAHTFVTSKRAPGVYVNKVARTIFQFTGVIIIALGILLAIWARIHSPHMGFQESINKLDSFIIKEPYYYAVLVISALVIISGILTIVMSMQTGGKKTLNINTGGTGDRLDEIKKAKELLDSGAIDFAEFEKIKKSVLDR